MCCIRPSFGTLYTLIEQIRITSQQSATVGGRLQRLQRLFKTVTFAPFSFRGSQNPNRCNTWGRKPAGAFHNVTTFVIPPTSHLPRWLCSRLISGEQRMVGKCTSGSAQVDGNCWTKSRLRDWAVAKYCNYLQCWDGSGDICFKKILSYTFIKEVCVLYKVLLEPATSRGIHSE